MGGILSPWNPKCQGIMQVDLVGNNFTCNSHYARLSQKGNLFATSHTKKKFVPHYQINKLLSTDQYTSSIVIFVILLNPKQNINLRSK